MSLPTADEIGVACGQLSLRVGDVAHNRAAARDLVREAAGRGARVVVLPELTNSGYVFRDADQAAELAEPVDGPTVTEWVALAARHELVLVAGLCERDPDGVLRNSAVVIDPDGVRAVYRKAHLFGTEARIFTPGRELPPVVATPYGRIAAMICYDLEFPEWVRTVALRGAELLCAPANWPLFPRPEGERPAEVVRAQANAAVNRMFVAVCDRVGTEQGVAWTGGSIVVDPDGFPLAGPLTDGAAGSGPVGPGLLLAPCRLSTARDKRIGEHNDVFADRHPGLYTSIIEPAAPKDPGDPAGRGGPDPDRTHHG